MTPNELRIGNYISIGGNKMVEIVEVGSFTIRYLDDTYNDNFRAFLGYDYLKPIELTEEILLKCGFFYDSDVDTFKISNYPMQLDSYGFYGYMFIMFGEGLCLIKYLHQLQNIYFALTGKELKIKL